MLLAGLTNTPLAAVRDLEHSVHKQLDILDPFISTQQPPTLENKDLKRFTVIIYNDAARCPDASVFSKIEFWHSDMPYEIQLPSTTSLKVITGPEYGGDTLVSSDMVAQAEKSRAAGLHVRRNRNRTPCRRVNTATSRKSVHANPGSTRRILGIPKPEPKTSYSIRSPIMLTSKCASTGSRIQLHSGVTWSVLFLLNEERELHLMAKKPKSDQDYERRTGKVAKDRQIEIWKEQGIEEGSVSGTRVQ
ncbi:hypothetical protein CY34DRAFT_18577 [Suillus luteus UH-Slu-Lm8-n1]|uniref:Uncharacterized protein n=1 Tax=Suillus luteus UH-Slu-Lm8-n1 TaxID=930992 RepID=A0A0C9ZUR5_9AGAM|nr:hypothetical protein CY34DRAFT_18577 [Suillus luteus UH-Slu-Lm8-n1]